jgi:hypothetical protein
VRVMRPAKPKPKAKPKAKRKAPASRVLAANQRLTPAKRRDISLRMRKYWAERRAQAKARKVK